MSDFVTRLVERQAGTVAMVQPRTPSMFAPTGSRTEPADFPVVDSLLPQADANHAPPASIRQGDHEGEGDKREQRDGDRQGDGHGYVNDPGFAMPIQAASASPAQIAST